MFVNFNHVIVVKNFQKLVKNFILLFLIELFNDLIDLLIIYMFFLDICHREVQVELDPELTVRRLPLEQQGLYESYLSPNTSQTDVQNQDIH